MTREHGTAPEPDPPDLRVWSSITSIVRPMSKAKCNSIPHSRPRPAPIGILLWAGGIVMSLFEPTPALGDLRDRPPLRKVPIYKVNGGQ